MATIHDAVLQLRPDLFVSESVKAAATATFANRRTLLGVIPADLAQHYIRPMIRDGRRRWPHIMFLDALNDQSDFVEKYGVHDYTISRARLAELHPDLDPVAGLVCIKQVRDNLHIDRNWSRDVHLCRAIDRCGYHLIEMIEGATAAFVDLRLPCGLLMFGVNVYNEGHVQVDVLIDPKTLRYVKLQDYEYESGTVFDDYGEETFYPDLHNSFNQACIHCTMYNVE